MKIDLIIKLAKLANNNPNENEANLAARKVCRMLEETEFAVINRTERAETRRPTGNPFTDDFSWMSDLFNVAYGGARGTGKTSTNYSEYTNEARSRAKEPPPEYKSPPKSRSHMECCECGKEFTMSDEFFARNPELYKRCYACRYKEKNQYDWKNW